MVTVSTAGKSVSEWIVLACLEGERTISGFSDSAMNREMDKMLFYNSLAT